MMEADWWIPFGTWVLADFLPFGDLVSGIWLLITLPRQRPDDFDCSARAYSVMRGFLFVGSVIDSIPEGALVLGIVVGVLVVPVAFAIYGEDRKQLAARDLDSVDENFRKREIREPLIKLRDHIWNCLRNSISDGKSISQFIFFDTNERTQEGLRGITYKVVFNALVLPHFPFAFLVAFAGCDKCSTPFLVIIGVQAVGGCFTEMSSVFFAVVSGDEVAVISAVFGMYSLIVSTVVAVYRSRKRDADEQRPNGQADGRNATVVDGPGDQVEETCTDSSPSHIYSACKGFATRLAYLVPPGVIVVSLLGVHYMEAGNKPYLGEVMAVLGFGLWGLALPLFFCHHCEIYWRNFHLVMGPSAFIVMAFIGFYYYALHSGDSDPPKWPIVMASCSFLIPLTYGCGWFATRTPNCFSSALEGLAVFAIMLAFSVLPGVIVISLLGVHYMEAGDKPYIGKIMTGLGFGLWALGLLLLPCIFVENMRICYWATGSSVFVLLAFIGFYYHALYSDDADPPKWPIVVAGLSFLIPVTYCFCRPQSIFVAV